MASELIGGAILSTFLQTAFEKLLTSGQVVGYFRSRRLDEKLLDKLRIKLLSVNKVLDDAEAKELGDRNVRAWLARVKDVVFDAEDLLDEIDTEASKLKLEAEFHSQTSISKAWNFFSASVSSFDKEIKPRLKELLDNLEVLASEKEILGLKEGVGMGNKVLRRLPTTSLVDEAAVYGRDDEKEIIIDLLLSNHDNGKNPTVICVVGMGGMGKTTLAQFVFNDHRMKDEFDLKAWVCVSEEFDVFRVTGTILKAVDIPSDDNEDLNVLQVKLKEKITGKKFLLVLDNVWNEDYLNWEVLQAPFIFGAQGSKILVTTRSEKVASTMHCAKLHQLKQLPEEDSWLLFAKHALHDGDSRSNATLEEVGRKIMKNCKGLPLALKTIGSLMYTKSSFEEWNSILRSEMWDMSDDESNIIPALRLSYQYLPSHLKRCFAYCSLFPKDYEFDKDQLLWLWMGENFLQCHQQNKSMKEVGDQFFHDLLSRSFFQPSSGDSTRFVMHDLISDLAKYISGEFCLRLDAEEGPIATKMTRHFSYSRKQDETFKRFEAIYKANKLRTFLPISASNGLGFFSHMSNKIIDELLPKLKCLRVLSLSQYGGIFELPDSIGNLKHLRYLDLSYSGVKKLPDSLCLLFNLQTLKLRNCRLLEELPSDMHKLINLRHLDFHGTKVRKMPMGLEKLKKLERLSSFYVGKSGESNIIQLAEHNLWGTLSILELQNVANPLDALGANLKKQIHLEELTLEWSLKDDGSQNEGDVLEKLQPHTNLKRLSIQNYCGTRFPDWFQGNSLSNIVFLELSNCKYCLFLPPLGILPSLKTLSLKGLAGIVVIGPEFYGINSTAAPFGSLLELIIEEMVEWEEWECQNALGAFPCLKELCIRSCPKLKKRLPQQLPSLLKLEIMGCKQLVASLPSSPAICELILKECGILQWESPPSTLKILHIGGPGIGISLLEKIEDMISNTCLESLMIFNCPNMEFPIRFSHTFLRTISIWGSCNSVKTLPLDIFPKLQMLILDGFSNLESFSVSEDLTYLTKLEISRCPMLVSFPKGGFFAPKLESFIMIHMESLKSLPEGMNHLFPSLRKLILINCPELKSFPEGGLPSNLKKLLVYDCPKLIASRMTWNLHSHTSLNELSIGDANLESFPDQGFLPATLTFLFLNECLNLKILDYKGLHHLSSLKNLSIRDCPRLQCLPNEGLPSSLSTLHVRDNCPLLIQRCQKQRGEDWKKIAHIPCVVIGGEVFT